MSSKSKIEKEPDVEPYLGFYPHAASTPGWVSYGFSLFRAKHINTSEDDPNTPAFIDLSETISSGTDSDTEYPRYRVVATTANPAYLQRDEFLKMLKTQQQEGHPRRVNYEQIWAIRDHSTSEIFICSPDVFVKLDGDKTTSARGKQIHIFRVFPTWMAMEIVALLHRAFLGSKDAPPTKSRSVPSTVTILSQMKNTVKSGGGAPVVYNERRKKADGTFETARSHTVPDFSLQVSKNVFLPICPTSFLYDNCPDTVNPDPKKKLKGPTVASSGDSKKGDDSESEEVKSTKRQRTTNKARVTARGSSDDEEDDGEAASSVHDDSYASHSRAKRGRELSSVGSLVDDGTDTDASSSVPDEEDSEDITVRFGRALRQLTDVIPDGREVTMAEVHRLMASRLKKKLPSISADALSALRKHLKVSTYDNSDLVEDDPDDELSELRRKTGVPEDLMLPVYTWPVLLHCAQDEDADIHDFIANAATSISRANSDWGKEVLRPTSCNQVSQDWNGLMKAYLLGSGAALTQYESILFSVMNERVESVAAEACATISAYKEVKDELEIQSAKLSEVEAELFSARAREEQLLAKIAELEQAKKLPPLPPVPPPKKAPRKNDF